MKTRSEIKRKTGLRAMSEKKKAKLAAEGTASPRSTLRAGTPKQAASSLSPSRGTRSGMMRRQSKPKRKPRSAEDRERVYGPDAFREWLYQQPCVVSGVRGDIECVHVATGGMGRKADWTLTVPMARELHRSLHRIGVKSFEAKHNVSLLALAALTQQRYAAARSQGGDSR